MEDKEVKKLVNKIFGMKNMPKVTNFAQEFSDGCKSSKKKLVESIIIKFSFVLFILVSN